MQTLLLDTDAWDLCVDATGNIAVASDPYSMSQDVASAARLFVGELYYGPATQGVPYFTQGLGQAFPTQLLRAAITEQALTVPGVNAAQVFLASVANRGISGQIQVQTTAGPLTVTL
jgi:hypothetical protein